LRKRGLSSVGDRVIVGGIKLQELKTMANGEEAPHTSRRWEDA
jgi:hypothetical protein